MDRLKEILLDISPPNPDQRGSEAGGKFTRKTVDRKTVKQVCDLVLNDKIGAKKHGKLLSLKEIKSACKYHRLPSSKLKKGTLVDFLHDY
jgi:hypothetical protein